MSEIKKLYSLIAPAIRKQDLDLLIQLEELDLALNAGLHKQIFNGALDIVQKTFEAGLGDEWFEYDDMNNYQWESSNPLSYTLTNLGSLGFADTQAFIGDIKSVDKQVNIKVDYPRDETVITLTWPKFRSVLDIKKVNEALKRFRRL